MLVSHPSLQWTMLCSHVMWLSPPSFCYDACDNAAKIFLFLICGLIQLKYFYNKAFLQSACCNKYDGTRVWWKTNIFFCFDGLLVQWTTFCPSVCLWNLLNHRTNFNQARHENLQWWKINFVIAEEHIIYVRNHIGIAKLHWRH